MGGEADSAGVGARHLLDNHGGMPEIASGAAISLWNEATKQSGAACLPPNVLRHDAVRFPPRMIRNDLALDKAADLLPKHLVIFSAGLSHAGTHLRADDPAPLRPRW